MENNNFNAENNNMDINGRGMNIENNNPGINGGGINAENNNNDSKPKAKFFSSVLVVFLVTAVFVSAAYYGYSVLKSKTPSLSEIVIETIDGFNSGYYNSGEFVHDFEVLINNAELNQNPGMMSQMLEGSAFSSKVRMTWQGISEKNVELSADLDISIKEQAGENFGFFSTQNLSLSLKNLNDNLYLKINEIPTMLSIMLPQISDLSSTVINQWFSFPKNMVDSYSKMYTDEFERSFGIDTESSKEHLVYLLDESKAFKIVSSETETINSVGKVTAITIEVDLDKLIDAIVNLEAKYGLSGMSNAQQQKLRSDAESLKEFPIKDGVFKILIDSNKKMVGMQYFGNIYNQETKISSVDLNSYVKNLNKSFEIERPKDSADFTQLLMVMYEIVGPMLFSGGQGASTDFAPLSY